MRKATGSYRTYSSLVKLQPWFLSLRWKTFFGHNCNLGAGVFSERPALGQNNLMMVFDSNITRACGFTEKITNDEVLSDFV